MWIFHQFFFESIHHYNKHLSIFCVSGKQTTEIGCARSKGPDFPTAPRSPPSDHCYLSFRLQAVSVSDLPTFTASSATRALLSSQLFLFSLLCLSTFIGHRGYDIHRPSSSRVKSVASKNIPADGPDTDDAKPREAFPAQRPFSQFHLP